MLNLQEEKKKILGGISIRNLFLYVLTGVFAGLVVSLFKKGIGIFAGLAFEFLKDSNRSFIGWATFLAAFLVLGTLIYLLTKKDQNTRGSGIPTIYGLIDEKCQVNWKITLPLRFITSIMTVGSGLSLGREGPSVQLGGLVGEAFSSLAKEKKDKKYFLGSGAGAGLAVAFNAPISGILFAIEEMFKKTDRKIFLSSALTVFSAVVFSNLVFGKHYVLKELPRMTGLSNSFYGYVLLFAILAGLSGVFFNFVVIGAKDVFKKIKINSFIKFLLPFLITGIIILADSRLFAAGENLIALPLEDNFSLATLIAFYFLKIFLLAICFGVSVPGGSLVPLVVIGALLGNIFGSFLASLGIIGNEMIIVFTVLGICGHFSAIVRSPITAVILMVEMTAGGFEYLLELGIVSLIAYLIAEFMNSKPFYEDLYERMFK